MTKQHYRRICNEVDVLCDLLACTVRSSSNGDRAFKQLEELVEAIPAQFATLAKRVITTPAQRRMYERNWRKLTAPLARKGQ